MELPAIANINNNIAFGAWWMSVIYELANAPLRRIYLYSGLDYINTNAPFGALITGFLVRKSYIIFLSLMEANTTEYDAKATVVAYEGDLALTGDQFLFNEQALSEYKFA